MIRWTIQKPDIFTIKGFFVQCTDHHLTTKQVWTIQILDLNCIQMVTVFVCSDWSVIQILIKMCRLRSLV